MLNTFDSQKENKREKKKTKNADCDSNIEERIIVLVSSISETSQFNHRKIQGAAQSLTTNMSEQH